MDDRLDALRKGWLARRWPEELLDRALGVGLSVRGLEFWVERDLRQRAEHHIPQVEELTFGELRGREASFEDNDRFTDLWANAGELVGDWEITVHRAPNAFAQFKLQENASIPVIEERGRLLACVVWAKRNLLVGGQRVSVHCGQGLRVRRDCRGRGFGNLVRAVPDQVWFPPTMGQYHYIRRENQGAVNFFKHTSPRVVENAQQGDDGVPGIAVTVLQYPAAGGGTGNLEHGTGEWAVRQVTPAEVGRCTALINRTNEGQDLFRPWTVESLELRLDEGYWGPRSPFAEHVYDWSDYWVAEEGGEIVACAGLWDRGRDVREHWRHKDTGEERNISVTALLDFGFAAGHETALARLIEQFMGETKRLGRDYLLAPLDQHPEVAALLTHLGPVPETRGLGWLQWDDESEKLGRPAIEITRPHTDIAYW